MNRTTVAYTSDSSDTRKGWDNFDTEVLLAVSRQEDQSLWSICNRVPAGIPAHLVRKALDVLRAEGLVARKTRQFAKDPEALIVELEKRTVYNLTEDGQTRVLDAQEAA